MSRSKKYKFLRAPSTCLDHLTISVHLISTYSGSSEEDFIDKEIYGTGDVYDVIDSPTAARISINAAIAIAPSP